MIQLPAMLEATRMPTFASWVGVAPSTTTMQLGAAPHLDIRASHLDIVPHGAMRTLMVKPESAPVPHPKKKPKPPSRPPHIRRRYYVPYTSIEDLRSAGLGIINESDAWLTGRPYGLPGTATIRLSQQQGGYHNPDGYHYNAAMVGGGFGDADTQALTAQVQQLVAAQQAQDRSLKTIAFWQNVMGSLVVASIAISATMAIAGAVRERNRSRSRRGR